MQRGSCRCHLVIGGKRLRPATAFVCTMSARLRRRAPSTRSHSEVGLVLTASHHPLLVVLSVAIAILASYAALDLATRVTVSRGRARLAWLIGGSSAMGIGI